MIKRICLKCKKEFYTFPSRITGSGGHVAKYCSRKCYSGVRNRNLIKTGLKTRFKKGSIPFSKLHPEIMPRGEKHPKWKGERVGYRGLHYWLRRVKGIPLRCEICGIEKTTSKSIHWANIDHKYSRNPKDYFAACSSCHKLFDSKS